MGGNPTGQHWARGAPALRCRCCCLEHKPSSFPWSLFTGSPKQQARCLCSLRGTDTLLLPLGGRLLTLGFSPQGQLVTKDYPPHALAVIGLLVAASTMCIPLGALGTLITRRLKQGDTAPVA